MAYRYREVRCPYCGHKFMFMEGSGSKTVEYYEIATGKLLQDTICPKCGGIVVAKDNLLDGLRPDDATIEAWGIRGI